jgi:small subunit ribosomal protein S8
VDMPNSKVKRDIAKVLKSEGYIRNHKIISDGRHRLIRVFLKYDEEGVPIIEGAKRVSKPSCLIGGLNVTYRQKAHCHTKGC